MCTAVSFQAKDHYFGRNLDLDRTYHESVTIAQRKFPFSFRCGKRLDSHYAMIGMATVADGYPLYYEATNEKGLSIAGLNFPNIACYHPFRQGKDNIASFELIPWLLGQCASVSEAKIRLSEINLWNEPFSQAYPTSPLHWLISDRDASVTVEPMADGLRIYENPVGVLTNNPPFDYQMYHLADYMNLTREPPENRFSEKVTLMPYCLGIGSMGLPGDLSSASRFVKAAFTSLNALPGETESESVSQFFHILGSVAQQKGLVRVQDNRFEYTVYSSCCNTTKGIYYYTTYENAQITGICMHHENLLGMKLVSYPLVTGQQFRMEN